MNKRINILFGILFAVSLILGSAARGESAPTDPPAKKCQIAGFFYEGEKPAPGVSFNLVLRLKFSDGYHAYQDQTKIELTDPKWATAEFTPPPGEPGANGATYLPKTVDLKLKLAIPANQTDYADKVLNISASFLGCTGNACDLDPTNFYPVVKVSELKPYKTLTSEGTTAPKPTQPAITPSANPAAQETANAAQSDKKEKTSGEWFDLSKYGTLMALLIAFLSGILIAFTPCVFPMISVTMAVLAGGERKSKMRTFVKSLFYVLGISLTYGILGILLSVPGSQWKNELQYNPYIFPAVGVIFAALALSMFGLYEIRLPMLSAGRFRGEGLGRAVLMGVIAGLVATPCVAAPLAALLIYVATQGNPLYGFAIMTSFAWGMGAVLILAGNFVSLVPGEWMETVKKVFGWILLGVALTLCEEQLGRLLYPAIGLLLLTASIFAGVHKVFYPGGWTKPAARILGILLVAGAAFCLYHTIQKEAEIKRIEAEAGKVKFESVTTWEEFQKQLEQTSKLGRPMFFYAHRNNCAACKEFETNVLTDKRVIELTNKFLCVEGNFSYFPTGDRGAKLREAYSFESVPTILFFRKDKNLSLKLQDNLALEKFMQQMKDVLNENN